MKGGWTRIDEFYKTRKEAEKVLKEKHQGLRYVYKVDKAGGLEDGYCVFYKFNK